MADPFRLRCITRLQALIAASDSDSNSDVPAEGEFVLTNAVFIGRDQFGESDPLPMVSILEVPINPEQLPVPPEDSTAHVGDWDLLIQGFVKDDKKNPTRPAYLLSAEVVRRLVLEKKRPAVEKQTKGKVITPLLGEKGVLNMTIGRPVCRPPDELSAKAYFWLPLRLRTSENLEDPYS